MISNPKISIIVPIYNVENYLPETLNSILKQSMIDEIEVLMIDDGSTDNSRYIIEEYALDCENFYAYHKSNEGQSCARNLGIELAKGEYLLFLDSDDIIFPDRCEKLYELAKKNDSDFVSSFGMRLTRYNFYDSLIYNNAYKNIETQKENIDLKEMPELLWDTFCTNKLYKKSFLDENNIRFIPNMDYEDIIFALEAYPLGKNISLTRDTPYLWRIRQSNNLSVTQQYKKIQNFESRIKMIKFAYDIAEKRNFNDNLKKEFYLRWINYDLILYLRIFYQFSEKYHSKIIDEIINALELIPIELRDNLNSSKKIMYKMVENKDIESLCNFSRLCDELMKNPQIPDDIKEEYKEHIDFEKDAIDERLIVEKEEISLDENNIYINFSERINYLKNDYPHVTKARLIDIDNNEYELELNEHFNGESKNLTESIKQIIVPINLAKDKKHMKIKVEYISDKIKKEALLSNSYRGVRESENFDIEIGIEQDGKFFMDMRKTNDLNIYIDNIIFNDNTFEISGKSDEKIEDFYIENVISLEKIFYPTNNEKDGRFRFSIPYEDILSHPVRKWEIRTKNVFNAIELNKKYCFYEKYSKIEFEKTRKKILISEDIYNTFNALNEKDDKIFALNNEKTKLNGIVGKLEEEKTELNGIVGKLEEEKTALNKSANKLEKEKTELNKIANKLEKEKTELNKIANELEKEKTVLYEENIKIKKENKELEDENKKLEKRNTQLNNRILAYKSRFVVKYTDKVRNFFK